MKHLIFLFLAILTTYAPAQNVRIGEWRSHLNYTEGIKSVEVGDNIFCATENGLFSVNKEDNGITKYSKTDGFSEVNISAMEYDPENDALMIAYYSTNIDLLQGNTIINIPDLDRKFITGKKTVNNIYFYDHKAYISTSFGVVVYDLERYEIKETYESIGDSNQLNVEIFDVTIQGDSIYAATENGIRAASLKSPNLLDFSYWKTIAHGKTTLLASFNNKLYAETKGFVREYDANGWSRFIDSLENQCNAIEVCHGRAIFTFESRVVVLDNTGNVLEKNQPQVHSTIMDKEGNYWFTRQFYTLVRDNGQDLYYYVPNGPFSKLSWDMTFADNKLWVASGSLTATGNPLRSSNGIYIFDDGEWTNKNFKNTDNFNKVTDILTIAIEPATGNAFLATYGWGIAEYYNGDIQTIYNKSNSSLAGSQIGDTNYINIGGLAFDEKGRLWVSNFAAVNPLSVRYLNGNWNSFSLGGEENRKTGQIVIDAYQQKWITLPLSGGLIVFDETQDPLKYVKLNEGEGSGNLPGEFVRAIAVDLEGRIWIGTDEGISVIYDPSAVFDGRNYDAQKIWISDGDESGYLLDNEAITDIAVDGANNKWIGTRNGVWYVSDDGTEIYKNFTIDNSPLPNNYIRAIAVNDNTGEVFFGTDGGIVSLRTEATGASNEFGEVYAYPNPVKPGYEGPIAIKGLIRDANLKITDVAGNMVFETYAQGGQAVWDGKNFDGEFVKSGVYLVLISNEDGTETNITKILIVR